MMKLTLQDKFLKLVDELSNEYDVPHVIFALKKISDQQMLFIKFQSFFYLDFDVNIKLLEQIKSEMDNLLFNSSQSQSVLTTKELKALLNEALNIAGKKFNT